MKKLSALSLLLLTSFFGFSQQNDATKNPKWTIGFGVNFIDNTSTLNNQYLNTSKQWNSIPTLSQISVEKSLSDKFSLVSNLSFNVLSTERLQNGILITKNVNYYGFDVNGKFFFDDFIANQSKVDAFLVLGLGVNSVDNVTNQSGNFGLGFNFWLQPNVGLRLQTLGKFGFEQNTLLNNHIQHTAELIFKF